MRHGDCLTTFELEGACSACIYRDSPVMKRPRGIDVDADGNVYLTQVHRGNGR